MTLPLSIFIIAKNEADRIPHTLASVQGLADDILVVDSGSEDATVQVSESLGARTLFHPWNGYGPQKVYAESLCRHDWVLNLDADEALSPELREEIRALFAHGDPDADAYRLRIMILMPFQKELPMLGAGTVQTRLYRRSRGGFKDAYVHDTVRMAEGAMVEELNHPVVHRCFRSHAHAVAKINAYSAMQAEEAFRRGKNPSALKVALCPVVAFFKCYFLRRYCFYGVEGVTQSWIYAFARFLKAAKTRELFRQQALREEQP